MASIDRSSWQTDWLYIFENPDANKTLFKSHFFITNTATYVEGYVQRIIDTEIWKQLLFLRPLEFSIVLLPIAQQEFEEIISLAHFVPLSVTGKVLRSQLVPEYRVKVLRHENLREIAHILMQIVGERLQIIGFLQYDNMHLLGMNNAKWEETIIQCYATQTPLFVLCREHQQPVQQQQHQRLSRLAIDYAPTQSRFSSTNNTAGSGSMGMLPEDDYAIDNETDSLAGYADEVTVSEHGSVEIMSGQAQLIHIPRPAQAITTTASTRPQRSSTPPPVPRRSFMSIRSNPSHRSRDSSKSENERPTSSSEMSAAQFLQASRSIGVDRGRRERQRTRSTGTTPGRLGWDLSTSSQGKQREGSTQRSISDTSPAPPEYRAGFNFTFCDLRVEPPKHGDQTPEETFYIFQIIFPNPKLSIVFPVDKNKTIGDIKPLVQSLLQEILFHRSLGTNNSRPAIANLWTPISVRGEAGHLQELAAKEILGLHEPLDKKLVLGPIWGPKFRSQKPYFVHHTIYGATGPNDLTTAAVLQSQLKKDTEKYPFAVVTNSTVPVFYTFRIFILSIKNFGQPFDSVATTAFAASAAGGSTASGYSGQLDTTPDFLLTAACETAVSALPERLLFPIRECLKGAHIGYSRQLVEDKDTSGGKNHMTEAQVLKLKPYPKSILSLEADSIRISSLIGIDNEQLPSSRSKKTVGYLMGKKVINLGVSVVAAGIGGGGGIAGPSNSSKC